VTAVPRQPRQQPAPPGAGGDPLTRAHDRLTAAVAALVDGDAWRAMLEVAARFPRYSTNNVLLITAQRPDATTVAGLRTWNTLGRRVRKGERGIAILAPCTYRPPATPGSDGAAAVEAAEGADPERREGRVLRGFRVAYVFDVTQTEGQPLPEVAPGPLTGDAPAQLWQRLAQVVEADGYRIERGPCGDAYGSTRFTEHIVRVRDDVAPAQATKTLAHELGHIRAEHHSRFAENYHRDNRCRGIAEVEAESIAYVVSAAAGLDTTGYTVPYIAHWAEGDTTVLRDTAARVITLAREILADTNTLPADTSAVPAAAWRSAVGITGRATAASITERAGPTR
jgi:antirestriction protein ArdC